MGLGLCFSALFCEHILATDETFEKNFCPVLANAHGNRRMFFLGSLRNASLGSYR